MIDLNKAKAITPYKMSKTAGAGTKFDVKVSIHSRKGTHRDQVSFTFYGGKLCNRFDTHGIVVYLLGSKIIFAIDDEKGYTFSRIKNSVVDSGSFKSADDTLRLFCVSNTGKYKMKYDYDSKLYYIDIYDRLDRGEN